MGPAVQSGVLALPWFDQNIVWGRVVVDEALDHWDEIWPLPRPLQGFCILRALGIHGNVICICAIG